MVPPARRPTQREIFFSVLHSFHSCNASSQQTVKLLDLMGRPLRQWPRFQQLRPSSNLTVVRPALSCFLVH